MQINIEKRHLFLISALMIFLAGIILVVAYGTNNPSIMGHSSQEVEVSINGQTKTLQQAIDDKSLGGAKEPDYDSGWFAVSANGVYEKNNPIGAIPRQVEMFYSPNSSGNPAYIVGMTNWNWGNGYNVKMTPAKFSIRTAKYAVCVYTDETGDKNPASGYYRFLAWK